MNLNIPNFIGLKLPKSASNSALKVNFQGKSDIVNFSEFIKTRSKIISELTKIGFNSEEIQELLSEYYNSEDYKLLINGEYDETEDKTYPVHHLDKEENLTPTEAIVYLYYDMDEYYCQNGDWGVSNNELTTQKAKNYDLSNNDFSPVELAEYMHQGFDIVLAGMIAKNRLDFETAKKVQPYYEASNDKFIISDNLKEAEYSGYLLSQNLEKLDYWTSDKKDEQGNLLNGLLRPLTNEEAAILVKDDYMPQDTKSLNNYIELNREFGYSLYEMDLKDLWDVSADNLRKIKSEVKKIPAKYTPKNLTESIDFVRNIHDKRHYDFLDDIQVLDNDKFFTRYPVGSIEYDTILSSVCVDRELRQKNIQVLNTLSEELLNKMTSGKADVKKGHFASLSLLLAQRDLDKRIEQMEELRVQNPALFNSMTREAVMDYLTNSDTYTRQAEALNIFLDMLSGAETKDKKPAKIIDFPTNGQ